jgi:hypothetical protein
MASSTKPNPIPDSYRRVTPCLVVRGGDKALKFYAAVFGATERMRIPNSDGTVAHAEIEIGDSVVIVEKESSGRKRRRLMASPAPRRSPHPHPRRSPERHSARHHGRRAGAVILSAISRSHGARPVLTVCGPDVDGG